MAETVLSFSRTLQTTDCYMCGMTFATFASWMNDRRNDHEGFYCPNGHRQHFISKSEAEKLRDQLAESERLRKAAEERSSTNYAAREKAERSLRKIEKRVKNGICPECNRTFANLARHIACKHGTKAERDAAAAKEKAAK